MAASGETYFHWADYVIFCLSLSLSVGIGVFYAIKDRRQKNNEEFLMAGRNMKVLPLTASTFATIVPSFGYVAFPVEVYYFGFGYIFNGIGACLGAIPIAEIMAPAFHRMKLTSAFEVFLMGLFTYAPSVALAQVSGLQVWHGIVVLIVVCTVYTTFGGMKAVIWSDFMQVFLMFAGIIALSLKGILDLGGFQKAFDIFYQGGRINKFNVWTYLIGAFFGTYVPLSSNQLAIQRYCTLPTAGKAKLSMYLVVPMYFLLTLCFLLTGLSMYGHFADCDPVASGQVQSVSQGTWKYRSPLLTFQLVPLLVMKVLGPLPGLPGLFVAALFAASLSTVSSGQNAIAAIVLKDFVEPVYYRIHGQVLTEKAAFFVAKFIAFLAGVASLLMALVITFTDGDLFLLQNKFMGIFVGPIGGLFTLAIIVKSVKDSRAVLTGFIVASLVGFTIAIGSELYSFTPWILPIGTDCPGGFTNSSGGGVGATVGYEATSSVLHSTTSMVNRRLDHTGFVRIFNLHPLYYTIVTFGLTVGVTVLVDQLIKLRQRRRAKTGTLDLPEHEAKNGYRPEVGMSANEQKQDKEVVVISVARL